MARVGRWLVGAAILAWVGYLVAAQATQRALPWWFGSLPWMVFAALVALRIVRESLRPAATRPTRRALTPGGQGLDEVQGIVLGRPPGLVPRYGDDEPTAAELVVPRTDPLDAGPWTVGRTADGSVVVHPGGADAGAGEPGAGSDGGPDRP